MHIDPKIAQHYYKCNATYGSYGLRVFETYDPFGTNVEGQILLEVVQIVGSKFD